MADQQRRIHPLHDVESPPPPPTIPLMPKHSSRSDAPPPPRPPPLKKRKRSCLCKCLCWTFSLLLILIIAIGIAIGILYLVFKPKLPDYSVSRLRVTEFNLTGENSLRATFNLTITAVNPNRRIGIHYESGSRIGVRYKEADLCQGSIPRFYQGHRNTTVMDLALTGETRDATALADSVRRQVEATGNVPLDLSVDQPVRVQMGRLKLMKVKFMVRCRLVVDNLSVRSPRIRQSSCDFNFRL